MPAERLTMRKVKEVLRLKIGQSLSDRQVAKSCCPEIQAMPLLTHHTQPVTMVYAPTSLPILIPIY